MNGSNANRYIAELARHYENYFGVPGRCLKLGKSKCDHAFISQPYLDGEELELFQHEEQEVCCYWLIPITEKERNFKIEHGCEMLEQLFEDKQLNYLNPDRDCLVNARD